MPNKNKHKRSVQDDAVPVPTEDANPNLGAAVADKKAAADKLPVTPTDNELDALHVAASNFRTSGVDNGWTLGCICARLQRDYHVSQTWLAKECRLSQCHVSHCLKARAWLLAEYGPTTYDSEAEREARATLFLTGSDDDCLAIREGFAAVLYNRKDRTVADTPKADTDTLTDPDDTDTDVGTSGIDSAPFASWQDMIGAAIIVAHSQGADKNAILGHVDALLRADTTMPVSTTEPLVSVVTA